jgi:hypothetical protein
MKRRFVGAVAASALVLFGAPGFAWAQSGEATRKFVQVA